SARRAKSQPTCFRRQFVAAQIPATELRAERDTFRSLWTAPPVYCPRICCRCLLLLPPHQPRLYAVLRLAPRDAFQSNTVAARTDSLVTPPGDGVHDDRIR